MKFGLYTRGMLDTQFNTMVKLFDELSQFKDRNFEISETDFDVMFHTVENIHENGEYYNWYGVFLKIRDVMGYVNIERVGDDVFIYISKVYK